MNPNKAYRLQMKVLKTYMKDKEPKYVAFLLIRGKYFRGLSIDKKNALKDFFDNAIVTKVKYKDKNNGSVANKQRTVDNRSR